MVVKEVQVKSVLSASKVYDYVVNPYTGCQHGCSYCIKTYAMIAPMLPGAEGLAELLKGKVDYVLSDRMNYHYADWVYRKHDLEDKLTDDFFNRTSQKLSSI